MDIESRLSRDFLGLDTRFRSLKEIPNFEYRWRKATPGCKGLLINLIDALSQFSAPNGAPAAASTASAAAAASASEAPDAALPDQSIDEAISSVLDFSGMQPGTPLATLAEGFLKVRAKRVNMDARKAT